MRRAPAMPNLARSMSATSRRRSPFSITAGLGFDCRGFVADAVSVEIGKERGPHVEFWELWRFPERNGGRSLPQRLLGNYGDFGSSSNSATRFLICRSHPGR